MGGVYNEHDSATRKGIAGIAELRKKVVAENEIWLKYHTTAGDGGGGLFRGVTGAVVGTYVDNNGTIIVPTGGDGSAAWLYDGISNYDLNQLSFQLTGATSQVGYSQSLRPQRIDADVSIFVNPATGNDANDGTQANPFKTFSKAMSLVPFHLTHQFNIYLADGTYAGDYMNLINLTNDVNSTNSFSIIGHHPLNPLYSDYQPDLVIFNFVNPNDGTRLASVFGGITGNPFNISVMGLTVVGGIWNYASLIEFYYCRIKNGAGSTHDIGTSGHGSLGGFHFCIFDTLGKIVNAADRANIHFDSCSALAVANLGDITNQSTISVENSYVGWGALATISAIGLWRRNGDNIYRATTTGTTGSTAPVHTSGIASDGGISWEYIGVIFEAIGAPNIEPGSMVIGNGFMQQFITASDLIHTSANNKRSLVQMSGKSSGLGNLRGAAQRLNPENGSSNAGGVEVYIGSSNVATTAVAHWYHVDSAAGTTQIMNLGRTGYLQTRGGVRVNNTLATLISGTGSPEGVKPSPIGSVYMRTDGSAGATLYVKESGGGGSTGWVAK